MKHVILGVVESGETLKNTHSGLKEREKRFQPTERAARCFFFFFPPTFDIFSWSIGLTPRGIGSKSSAAIISLAAHTLMHAGHMQASPHVSHVWSRKLPNVLNLSPLLLRPTPSSDPTQSLLPWAPERCRIRWS